MTVHKLLADIVDALRTSHLEHEAIRTEMATKQDLTTLEAAIDKRLKKLGLEFEAFRHDTKITLEMLSELMGRTGRHEKDVGTLDRRVSRVENHLKLKPLPNAGDQ
jgi:tRNA C32,U32 (ribose-2'-O)-methylase TrmJ